MLVGIYGLEHETDITLGSPLLSFPRKAKYKKQKVLDDINYGRTLELCNDLFSSLSGFILDSKPYPHKIKVSDKEFIMLPAKRWVMSDKYEKKRKYVDDPSWHWDYSNGTIRDQDSILTLKGIDPKTATSLQTRRARRAIENATRYIEEGNSGLNNLSLIHI